MIKNGQSFFYHEDMDPLDLKKTNKQDKYCGAIRTTVKINFSMLSGGQTVERPTDASANRMPPHQHHQHP